MRCGWDRTFALLLLLPVLGCDPAKIEEQEAIATQAQATADSLAAVAKARMDSIMAAAVVDSTTLELDSGVWNIEEPQVDFSEDTEEDEEEFVYEKWKRVADDTVAIDRRYFNEAAIAEYLKDPDLDYDRVLHHDNLWWDRFMRWLNRKLGDLFGTEAGSAVFDNMHWILLGVAVVIVLWFLRRHLFGSVFGAGPKRTRQVTEIEENIAELDLDKLLGDAEKAANWRLALRYQWLKVLRRLVDEGRIKWQPRFTDADYLAQLKDPAWRVTFSEMSFLFKWVWYGDAPMDAQRYERMKPAFESAHSASPKSNSEPAPTASVPNA